MRLSVLGFLAGMLIPLAQAHIHTTLLWDVALLFFVTCYGWLSSCFSSVVRKGMGLAHCVLAGYLWFSLAALSMLHAAWPPTLENIPLTLSGQISSLPVQQHEQVQFYFKIDHVCTQKICLALSRQIVLNGRHLNQPLYFGQPYVFIAKLKRPHGYANPGGFDREAFLFQNQIVATGYILSQGQALSERKLSEENIPAHPLHRIAALFLHPWFICDAYFANIRLRYNQFILRNLANAPFVGVIDALTIGNTAGITPAQWQVFQATGTTHLIAISGLHIGMIASLCYLLLGWLWRCWPRLMHYLPSQKISALGGIAGSGAYTALSGFSIPAERTFIMITVWDGMSVTQSLHLTFPAFEFRIVGYFAPKSASHHEHGFLVVFFSHWINCIWDVCAITVRYALVAIWQGTMDCYPRFNAFKLVFFSAKLTHWFYRQRCSHSFCRLDHRSSCLIGLFYCTAQSFTGRLFTSFL